MSVNIAIELCKIAVANQFEYKLFLCGINTSVLQSKVGLKCELRAS